MKVVAVSLRIDIIEDRNEMRDSIKGLKELQCSCLTCLLQHSLHAEYTL